MLGPTGSAVKLVSVVIVGGVIDLGAVVRVLVFVILAPVARFVVVAGDMGFVSSQCQQLMKNV
jgi:hypothetical protein